MQHSYATRTVARCVDFVRENRALRTYSDEMPSWKVAHAELENPLRVSVLEGARELTQRWAERMGL